MNKTFRELRDEYYQLRHKELAIHPGIKGYFTCCDVVDLAETDSYTHNEECIHYKNKEENGK